MNTTTTMVWAAVTSIPTRWKMGELVPPGAAERTPIYAPCAGCLAENAVIVGVQMNVTGFRAEADGAGRPAPGAIGVVTRSTPEGRQGAYLAVYCAACVPWKGRMEDSR